MLISLQYQTSASHQVWLPIISSVYTVLLHVHTEAESQQSANGLRCRQGSIESLQSMQSRDKLKSYRMKRLPCKVLRHASLIQAITQSEV